MSGDEKRVGKADLHVHTAAGDSMAEIEEIFDYVESATDLDVVAITDHDDLKGAVEARERWARGRYRFQVIVGMEVTALEGHIIALFLERPLPSLHPLEEVLVAIHKQSGLAIIPHPLCWLTRSVGQKTLELIMNSPQDGVYFDGLEAAGQAIGARVGRKKALRLNREHYHLPEVGGSDAHFLKAVGSAYTEFEGSTAEELRRCILEGKTRGVDGQHPSPLEIGAGQMLRQAWRGFTATPRQMGWGPTAMSFVKRIFPIAR